MRIRELSKQHMAVAQEVLQEPWLTGVEIIKDNTEFVSYCDYLTMPKVIAKKVMTKDPETGKKKCTGMSYTSYDGQSVQLGLQTVKTESGDTEQLLRTLSCEELAKIFQIPDLTTSEIHVKGETAPNATWFLWDTMAGRPVARVFCQPVDMFEKAREIFRVVVAEDLQPLRLSNKGEYRYLESYDLFQRRSLFYTTYYPINSHEYVNRQYLIAPVRLSTDDGIKELCGAQAYGWFNELTANYGSWAWFDSLYASFRAIMKYAQKSYFYSTVPQEIIDDLAIPAETPYGDQVFADRPRKNCVLYQPHLGEFVYTNNSSRPSCETTYRIYITETSVYAFKYNPYSGAWFSISPLQIEELRQARALLANSDPGMRVFNNTCMGAFLQNIRPHLDTVDSDQTFGKNGWISGGAYNVFRLFYFYQNCPCIKAVIDKGMVSFASTMIAEAWEQVKCQSALEQAKYLKKRSVSDMMDEIAIKLAS